MFSLVSLAKTEHKLNVCIEFLKYTCRYKGKIGLSSAMAGLTYMKLGRLYRAVHPGMHCDRSSVNGLKRLCLEIF